MTPPRNVVLLLGLLLAPLTVVGCASTGGNSAADPADFPKGLDSIEMIVPFSAGGSTDTVARLVAPRLEASFGVPVQVINKPEGNGQTGLQEIANSRADGSVIGSANLPSIFTTYLDPNTDVDYDRDSFAPAGGVTTFGSVLVVRTDSGIKDLDDLTEKATAAPTNINMGAGAVDDLLPVTALEKATGAEYNLIPFAGGSADKLTALLGGKVDLIVAAPSAVEANVETGELHIIANLGTERGTSFPDVPTATEQGYDIVQDTTNGFVLPAGTPDTIVQAYSDALSDIDEDLEFADAVEALGFDANFVSATEFGKSWDARANASKPIIENSGS